MWRSTVFSIIDNVRNRVASTYLYGFVLLGYVVAVLGLLGFADTAPPDVLGPFLTWFSMVFVVTGVVFSLIEGELRVAVLGPVHAPLSRISWRAIVILGSFGGAALAFYSTAVEVSRASLDVDWQRALVAVAWVPSSFLSLKIVGLPLGVALLLTILSAMCGCCGLFHVCGRARFLKQCVPEM